MTVPAGTTLLEVELKFPLPEGPGRDRVLAALEDCGAEFGTPVTQRDTYLAHPQRDFAATDEALRVRLIEDGRGPDTARGRVTYKGPRLAGGVKSREEVELPLAPGRDAAAKMVAVFERLGFEPVLEVVKTRRTLSVTSGGREIEVVRDSVEGLGEYLELETLADPDGAGGGPRGGPHTGRGAGSGGGGTPQLSGNVALACGNGRGMTTTPCGSTPDHACSPQFPRTD